MRAPNAWPGLRLGTEPGGGNRNVVLAGELDGRRVVVRHSRRSAASLDWECDLLAHLRGVGIVVPGVIPAAGGARHVDGWMVQEFVDGGAPQVQDAAAVGEALRRVHASTIGWPQRPGFRSARALLDADHGGDVDLARMPREIVVTLRDAWREADAREACVVHGDAGPSNVLITAGGEVALIDWDEARVDDPLFDDLATRDPLRQRAQQAWEIACCWWTEPDYARRLWAQFDDSRGAF